ILRPALPTFTLFPYTTLFRSDGVPLDKLYPLDFDRAYKKLDTIKNSIDVWWTGGAQTSQLLKSGEVDICAAWNGRVQAAIDDGRSEEHTSELQSRENLVCRLL